MITDKKDKKIINIGILAHVDAGKTTVTESMLYNAGIIKELGRVDKKNTQTDTLEIEKERGITIKSTAISFDYNDLKINILDTPGHMDFIAEVERSMGVLDGAILVISSVEGVQSQTKVISNTLKRLNIPTIILINKLDRMCSNYMEVFHNIKANLSKNVVLIEKCEGETSRDLNIEYINDIESNENVIDTLSNVDDSVLDKYVTDGFLEKDYVIKKLRENSKKGLIYPVFIGSAFLNIGVDKLLSNIENYLPTAYDDNNSELSGVVFKIERTTANDKKAYVRLFGGQVIDRGFVNVNNSDEPKKVVSLFGLKNGHTVGVGMVGAGDIAIITGIRSLKIGDIIGKYPEKYKKTDNMAEPVFKVQISTKHNENEQGFHDNFDLYHALSNMADEDPLLQIEYIKMSDSIYIKLFGEVQKEVISETLKRYYGLEVEFSETQTIYKEAVIGEGTAEAVIYRYPNVYGAGIFLKVEPLPEGSGLKYVSNVNAGKLPKSFLQALVESVYETSKHALYGWELTDTLVTILDTVYDSVGSSPSDFRDALPMVLMEAVDKAKTKLLEPISEFELTTPQETLSKAIYDLKVMNAVFDIDETEDNNYIITGTVPLDNCKDYQVKVLSYTKGKGLFSSRLKGYSETQFSEEKVSKCKYINGLNKKEYLMMKSNGYK